MHFRKAVISDIPTIQEIAEATWRPTYGHILSEEQTLYMLDMMYGTAVLQKQIDSSIDFFLAEDEGNVLGYFSIEEIEPGKMKLHKIYLRPGFKSRGAGTQIIERIKEIAQERGINQIELNVNKHNSAVSFYEKMGFIRVQEMVLDIGNGYVMDDYVMQLNLRPTQ